MFSHSCGALHPIIINYREGASPSPTISNIICLFKSKCPLEYSNHIHGIINIVVGATPCSRPISCNRPPLYNHPIKNNTIKGENTVSPLQKTSNRYNGLGQYISWFKRMTTNKYIYYVKNDGWESFNKRLWQRNYYDHIIRNEKSLNKIREYISNNPENWERDIERITSEASIAGIVLHL